MRAEIGVQGNERWHEDAKGSGDGMMTQQKPLGGQGMANPTKKWYRKDIVVRGEDTLPEAR